MFRVHPIDYAGRIEFLKALEQVKWSGGRSTPLAKLRTDVLPLYRDFFVCLLREKRTDPSILARELYVPFGALRTSPPLEAQAVAAALDAWGAEYQFTNDWLLEAANDSALAGLGGNTDRLIWCLPHHPLVQPPQPVLRAWAYPAETWQAYRTDQDAQYDYLLKAYKANVLKHQRVPKAGASTSKHARWTALRVAGNTYGQIEILEQRRGTSAKVQVLHREIRKFAARIGLVHPSIT